MVRFAAVRRVAEHEIPLMLRSARFLACFVVLQGMIALAFASAWTAYRTSARSVVNLEKAERKAWDTQGVKNQHLAIHQGIIVFQPVLPLSAIDSGILPFTGSAALVGEEHEGALTHKPSEWMNSLRRLGSNSIAGLLLLYVPLVLLLLFYDTFSAERENGLLRQMLSLGISGRELLLGKALSVLTVCALLCGPACCLAAATVLDAGRYESRSASALRVGLLLLSLFLYELICGAAVLLVASLASTSRTSLFSLLVVWLLACLLLPSAGLDVAERLHRAPDSLTFASMMDDAHRSLPSVESRRSQVRGELMRKYGVTNVRDLPIDPLGPEALREEQELRAAYHPLVQSLYSTYTHQLRTTRILGYFDPALSERLLSQSLAGTDFEAYRRFADNVEGYRETMVQYVAESVLHDTHYRTNKPFPGTDIVLSMGSDELWRGLPEWRPRMEAAPALLHRVAPGLLVELVWLVMLGGACWFSVGRLRL